MSEEISEVKVEKNVKAKPVKVVTHIREVTYVDEQRSHKDAVGWEIVKEELMSKEDAAKYADVKPKVVGSVVRKVAMTKKYVREERIPREERY